MAEVSEETMRFVTAEILLTHTICDRGGVPRTVEDELLSMSQRVHILERCFREMCRRTGKGEPEECH